MLGKTAIVNALVSAVSAGSLEYMFVHFHH